MLYCLFWAGNGVQTGHEYKGFGRVYYGFWGLEFV